MKINKKKGILFWITGISGSGKTTISKKIFNQIKNKYGKTILLSGDDLRSFFNLKKYSKIDRYIIALGYSKLCKKITNQGINVIFATVSMSHKIRKYNSKNIENYFEIYIKSDLGKIIKKNKKKIYFKKNKNIVGIDIRPELPKKPKILINNDFSKSIKFLSNELIKKIFKVIKL